MRRTALVCVLSVCESRAKEIGYKKIWVCVGTTVGASCYRCHFLCSQPGPRFFITPMTGGGNLCIYYISTRGLVMGPTLNPMAVAFCHPLETDCF